MNAPVSPIEQFEATGSHFEVGFAIGKRFAEQINRLFDNYRFLQQRILPYHRTPEGQARYQKLYPVKSQQFSLLNRSSFAEGLLTEAEREGSVRRPSPIREQT